MVGLHVRLGSIDNTRHQILEDVLVHELHAVLLPGLDHGRDLVDLAFPDQRPDGVGSDHDLLGGTTPLPALLAQEDLRDHSFDGLGEHGPDLLLLVRREDVDDAVDGFGRRVRVQRTEHQVARFGSRDTQLDGLPVAHLSNQDDVQIFPKRRPQCVREALRVGADLTLVDQALLVGMHELDGVLDGEDMVCTGLVDEVHHGRQRGALPRPRGTGDEHQALGEHAHLPDGVPEAQLIGRQDIGGDGTHDRADPVLLIEDIDPEARDPWNLVGEVEVHLVEEPHPPVLFHDLEDELLHVLGRELAELDPLHVAMDTDDGHGARGEMEVRPPLVHHHLQKLVNLGHQVSLSFVISLIPCLPVVNRGVAPDSTPAGPPLVPRSSAPSECLRRARCGNPPHRSSARKRSPRYPAPTAATFLDLREGPP